MAKYRVKYEVGMNLPYTPQIWRWWFPFWRPLSVSCGEGGSWWHTAYETAEKAWDAVDARKFSAKPDKITYQYQRLINK